MTTRYTINPSLRLCTWCLVIGWHEVKDSLLQSESIFSCEGRSIYTKGDRCMIMAQVNEKRIDFYYCHDTKFDNRNIQSWLRNIIKNKILDLANIELPKRLHYWEKEKNLYARQVIIKNWREGTYGGNVPSINRFSCRPRLWFSHWNWLTRLSYMKWVISNLCIIGNNFGSTLVSC